MRNESSRAAGAGSVCTRGRWQNHCTCSTWACQTLKHAAGQFCGTQQCRASHLSVNRTERERERQTETERQTERDRDREPLWTLCVPLSNALCAYTACITVSAYSRETCCKQHVRGEREWVLDDQVKSAKMGVKKKRWAF